MTDFFLTDAGEFSLVGIGLVWAFTLLFAIPGILKMRKSRQGDPLRDKLLKRTALIALWPFIAFVALAALPFILAGIILKSLLLGAPIWGVGIHAAAIVSGFVSRGLNRAADYVVAKFERLEALLTPSERRP